MRQIGKASLIALFAAVVLSGTASAAVTNPVIDWTGPESAAWEPNFVAPHTSVAGNVLTIVGRITLPFNAPLDGLNPVGGNPEYTFVFTGMTSQGTVDLGPIRRTNYSGGSWAVYSDASPESNFGTNPPNATAPSTFNDGVVVLSGVFNNFYTVSNELNNGGNYNADILVTGGASYGRMVENSALCGYLIGVWNRTPGSFPTGYIRSADGKMDFFGCPVSVAPSTWSRIKGLLDQ
jgi:hypothetical protein